MTEDMWKKKIEEKKILKSKYEIKVVWDTSILWHIVYLNISNMKYNYISCFFPNFAT